MKNALILHATANNPQGNWYMWLKEELIKKGWNVWLPELPDADKPNAKKYTDFILSNKNWSINEKSIIIGHSSGAVEILHLLQHLPEKIRVNSCYLIGSFKNDLGWPELKGLFEDPLDFSKIKNHAKKFVLIHSDNDPHCPLEHAQYLSQQLDGILIILKGQGHFNLQKGPEYKEFPRLLEIIEKNA